MDWSNGSEQFLRQFSEVQKLAFNNWELTMNNVQKFNVFNVPDNFDKALRLQEDLVRNAIDFQEHFYHFSIDMQRKFWDGYFTMLRRS
ncbi:MAG TPA: hypothetical protein VK203_28810 [Nostocaceae cyanobacterium]|nr:hypothetical protein [Nostocaceae cyanobacterium]